MSSPSHRPLFWLATTGVLAGLLCLPASVGSTARADELSRLKKLDREIDQLIASLKKKHHHKKHHHKKHHHKKPTASAKKPGSSHKSATTQNPAAKKKATAKKRTSARRKANAKKKAHRAGVKTSLRK